MKKKVGILTLYYKNRNYGGLLQAYALQKVISDGGYECEQVSYQLSGTPLKGKIENAIHYGDIWSSIKTMFQEICLKKFFLRKIREKCARRIAAFDYFENKIPHSAKVYNHRSIEESTGRYDAYVVGSDQIWNAGIDLENFLLKFAGREKTKIAYAASSNGINYKGIQKELVEKELQKFDAISVRESSLNKQLSMMGVQSVENVIDPVFLLGREEWERVIKPVNIKEPYILCYFLGTNRKQRKIAEKISQKRGCRLVVFPYIVGNSFRACDVRYGDERDFESGPAEFLGLIKGAECIITDSFHALAFSIIFEKTFCVFPRCTGIKESKSNSRMKDFLSNIGVDNYFVYTQEEAEHILNQNDEKCKNNEILLEWIETSKEWLYEALAMERSAMNEA